MLSELNIPFYSYFIKQFSKGWKKEPPNQTIKVRFSFSLAEMVGILPRAKQQQRVAFADFSAAPWQGFEKSERCPNNSSLFLPQAAVVVVALG